MGQISISFDLGSLLTGFKISPTEINNLTENTLMAVAEEISRQWRKVASDSLHSTRRQYLAGIQPVEYDGYRTASITLIGTLPNMLESGASPFDMKIAFMKKAVQKVLKDGSMGKKYFNVPFRWATPGAMGENEAFSNKLPQDVYDIIKGKSAKVTSMGGEAGHSDLLQEDELPGRLRGVRGVRERIMATSETPEYPAYTHKDNIFSGLGRYQQLTESGVLQSHYMTFRRVSENSDPMSWIHRGLQARNFAEQAVSQTDVESIVENMADDFLTKKGL